MPTPVGHSLAGFAIHLASRRRTTRPGWLAAGLVALANLPDVDFLPGYLVGEPRLYHWGPAHSVAAAVVVGALVGLFAQRLGDSFLLYFVLATSAYASHLALDLQLGPRMTSAGLQVFWPFSAERYFGPWQLFQTFPRSLDHMSPVRALFTRGVLPLMLREVAILGPVCAAAWLAGRGRSRPKRRRGGFAEPRVADS